jgi:hypothetical protein
MNNRLLWKILFFLFTAASSFRVTLLQLYRRGQSAFALITLLLLQGGASAQWYDIAGPNAEHGTAIASNATGQTFIGGTFHGSLNLSATVNLVGSGSVDGYLAMIDGGIVWAITVSSTVGAVTINEVAPLSDGGVVVVGSFTDDLLPGILVAVGSSDAFVVRYDAAGTALWAAQIAGDAYDTAYGVAVDAEDNIFVTGYFSDANGGTTFYDANGMSTATVFSSGAHDGYVVAYDVDGLYLWSQVFGGTGFDDGIDVATDAAGDVYVTGSFSDTATIASVALTVVGDHDVFVAKYDNSGLSQWAVAGGGTARDEGRGITTTVNGDVVVTGFITDSADFSGLAATASGIGDEEIVLVCYDASGFVQWVGTNGGNFDDRGSAVAETLNGSFAVTGYSDDGNGDIAFLFDSSGAVVNGWGPGVFTVGDDVTVDPISGQVWMTGDQGLDAFVIDF